MMGFSRINISSFFILYCCFLLCWLRENKAMDNSTLLLLVEQLDDTLLEYARNSLPRRGPQTGVLYNATFPSSNSSSSNFTAGIQVSIVRLRRDSFWGRGAPNYYPGIRIPPKIFTHPSFTRLDLVFSNLANQSSYYFNLPNYTLLAPVVGFNAYAASRNSTRQIGNFTTPVTRLNLTLFGGPILVQFPNININISLPQNNIINNNKKCVIFYTNGTYEITTLEEEQDNMSVCIVRDQGHFSIVAPQSSNINPEQKQKGKKKKKLWKWWVFGFAVGVLGFLLFGFILFMLIRTFRLKKIRRMEKQAENNEVLEATNVGQSKMPLATLVRTQPAAIEENDYLP